MNMFYEGLDTQQKITQLGKELKNRLGMSNRKKIKIFDGNCIGNNMLFLLEHVTEHGFLGAEYEKRLLEQCNKYNITNKIISYHFSHFSDLTGLVP